MTREIKFRAWDFNAKQMQQVTGLYFELYRLREIETLEHKGVYIRNFANPQEIIAMQYTGLTDKNGKEIYEGDVIDDSYISPLSGEKIEKKYVIEFEDGCFWAKMIPSHPYGSTYLNFKHKESVVIGNIYENPELI